YAVYADWLLGQGNLLGEWIVLQQQDKLTPARKKRAAQIEMLLGLPGAKLATFEWRWGFWKWLRFQNDGNWMSSDFDAVAAAKALFSHPACAVLEELRLGIMRWDDNFGDIPKVIAEAGRHAWARDLRALFLGDTGDHVDMAHQVVGHVGPA